MRFYDTNVILNHYKNITEPFYLADTTLMELEKIKESRFKDEEVKHRCRKAVQWLDQTRNQLWNMVRLRTDPDQYLGFFHVQDSPDARICACARNMVDLGERIEFVTEDLLCKILAEQVFGLYVEPFAPEDQIIYKGYRRISGTASEINDYMANMKNDNWHVNEYLIIDNTDEGTSKEMRFDGDKFVALKLPPSKFVKGKNSLQRCALDMGINQDITICAFLGQLGSGKTYLAMKSGLYSVNEKGYQGRILGIREPYGEGKEVGYLQGSFEDKTDQFFFPLTQQLSGGLYELEALKQKGMLEFQIPFYMKGTTYNDTIMICDEAEDLTEKQIRLIGTRVGQNSRIFFSGDYRQSLVNATYHNALIRMCNELKGNPQFACVFMDEDVRSSTSRTFANLFI